MDIEEDKLKRILSDLERYRSDYNSSSGKTRDSIEENIRYYGNSLPDELYFELNQKSASGLFKRGFVELDLDRSIITLSRMLGI